MNWSIRKYSNLAIDKRYCGWRFFKTVRPFQNSSNTGERNPLEIEIASAGQPPRLGQSYRRNPLLEKQNKAYCSFNSSTPNRCIRCVNQAVDPILKGKSSFSSSKYMTDCPKNQPGSKCRGQCHLQWRKRTTWIAPWTSRTSGNTSCTFQSRLPPKDYLLLNMLAW